MADISWVVSALDRVQGCPKKLIDRENNKEYFILLSCSMPSSLYSMQAFKWPLMKK